MAGRKPQGGYREKNWHSLNLKNGEAVSGWIAGDWIGVDVHPMSHHIPTKPCLHRYGHPKHECPGCKAGHAVDWIAYVPFYREGDDMRCITRVHQDQLPWLDKIAHLKYVTFRKPVEQSLGVQVVIRPKQLPYDLLIPSRKDPACIAGFLPTLWRLVGVIAACDLLGAVPDPAELPKLAPPAPAPAPLTPAQQQLESELAFGNEARSLAKRFSLAGDGTAFTERLPNGALSVAEPHRNGSPKKPK
jgi:hypothetical protein